jgi:lipopolysaccharide transport system ATP-binding protein
MNTYEADDSPLLAVHDLGKTYRLWRTPRSRLWVPLAVRAARGAERWGMAWLASALHAYAVQAAPHFEALNGVSFALGRGEALGVIGANGSGKSTLLQLVAGVLQPSAGRVEVRGRIAALLELGSGFNPEMTGRENVAVNAAILGMSPEVLQKRLPSIIDFADVGQHIDQPVKTYSSGMAVRLAFAVQVHLDPDLLIVDEALAVGDAAFQAKAMAKVDEILRRGTSLLFVGHDLNVVKAFCHRALLLENGRVVKDGLPDEVITDYLYRSHQRSLAALGYAERVGALEKVADGFATERMRVLASSINGGVHASLRCGDEVDVVLRLRVAADVANPLLIFDLMDARGLQLSGRRIPLPRGEDVVLAIRFRAEFQQGVYRCRLRLLDSADLNQHVVLARQEGVPSFEVVDDSRERFTGLFPVPMTIDVQRVRAD